MKTVLRASRVGVLGLSIGLIGVSLAVADPGSGAACPQQQPCITGYDRCYESAVDLHNQCIQEEELKDIQDWDRCNTEGQADTRACIQIEVFCIQSHPCQVQIPVGCDSPCPGCTSGNPE